MNAYNPDAGFLIKNTLKLALLHLHMVNTIYSYSVDRDHGNRKIVCFEKTRLVLRFFKIRTNVNKETLIINFFEITITLLIEKHNNN